MISVRNLQEELKKGKCLRLYCDSGGKQHYMQLRYSNKYYYIKCKGKINFTRKYMQEKTLMYHLEQWFDLHNYTRVVLINI